MGGGDGGGPQKPNIGHSYPTLANLRNVRCKHDAAGHTVAGRSGCSKLGRKCEQSATMFAGKWVRGGPSTQWLPIARPIEWPPVDRAQHKWRLGEISIGSHADLFRLPPQPTFRKRRAPAAAINCKNMYGELRFLKNSSSSSSPGQLRIGSSPFTQSMTSSVCTPTLRIDHGDVLVGSRRRSP